MEDPGLSAMSPVMLVAPVLVIEAPASTASVEALPRMTELCAVVCTGITIRFLDEGEGSS